MLLLLDEANTTTEAEAPVNPIVPEIGELFWGATMFAALYVLIKFVFLPPVLKVMDQRAAKIKADVDAAEYARKKQSNLSLDLEDQLSDVKAEAASILDQARSEASAERARLISKAEHEVAAMKQATETEIASERSKALKSLRPEVVKLSVEAARKVLERDIDPVAAKPVLEQKLGNLS